MSERLPDSANLNWLKKTAKQTLRNWKAEGRDAQLADAQLALARQYGFSSWRSMKAAIEKSDAGSASVQTEEMADFLRLVAAGDLKAVQNRLTAMPQLVHETGPHPFWGGAPQALHVAIDTRQSEMVDCLIAAGANVNGDNGGYDHWSPVMLTVSRNQPEIRAKLISEGAEITLWEALLLGDDEEVERLLSSGVEALSGSRPSGSPLGLARTTFAIDRLLECGAIPEEQDQWGASAIETLSRLGSKGRELVAHMQKRGISARPEEFARLGDRQTLQALYRSDPGSVRSDPVIMGAVDFGHHALVRWLLECGASANARSSSLSKNTALHSAAWNGDMDMVQMLVEHGADPTTCDEEYRTTPQVWAEVSIDVTKKRNCSTVAAFLRELSAG